MSRLVLTLARRVVRIASGLVPPTTRGQWLLEWEGELSHRTAERSDGARLSLGASVDLLVRSFGSIRHAWWLRRSATIRGAAPGEGLRRNLRLTLRSLRKSPGFVAIAIGIMGLGIGANTAIFSIVNAVLFRPLPYVAPDELVRVFTTERGSDRAGAVSYPDFRDFRSQTDVLQASAISTGAIVSLVGDGSAEAVFGEYMSSNFFSVAGLQPALGRLFVPGEDERGSAPVAVISHRTWARRFGSRPDVVGETIRINGHPVTIVGVGPHGFDGTIVGVTSEFWMPLGTAQTVEPQQQASLENREARGLFMLARMRPGVRVEQVGDALNAMQDRLSELYPETNRNRSVVVLPANDVRLHPVIDAALYPVSALLLAVVALVLLVACTNLANLLLVRGTSRRREIAVRLALGAPRRHIVSQLLTESALLGVVGGFVGIGIAHAIAKFIVSFEPPIPVPVAINLQIDRTVLAYALVLSFGTGVIFGLVPALRSSRPDLVGALKDESGTVAVKRGRFNLRDLLVVAQVTTSVVLLIAAGLFVRALGKAQHINPGFETRQAAVVSVDVTVAGYDVEAGREFFRQLRERLEPHPAVEAVGLTDRVPLGAAVQTTTIRVDGFDPGTEDRSVDVDFARADAGYFEAMGIPILRGRTFAPTDVPGAPVVAIVSEAMANRFWGTTDVVGERFFMGRELDRPVVVVGVARDTKVRTLGEADRPYVYYAFSQDDGRFASIVVRTRGEALEGLEATRAALRGLDPDVPLFEAKTMEEHLAFALFAPRMGAALLAAFGALAVLLASIGLYGVVAFSVSQRTREVGIRVALGAETGHVVRLVVREGMVLVAAGVGLGLALSLVAMRPLAGILIGVAPTDAATFGAVSAILAVVALVASYLPARRAAAVDPLIALRAE